MKKTMLCIICGFVMCLSGFADTPSLNAKLAKQIPSKQELTQEQIQLVKNPRGRAAGHFNHSFS